jgi:hypothetical protein
MVRAWAVGLLVLELGCVKGPQGDPGPVGPEGPERAPVLAWVDASGALVSAGAEPTYVAPDGRLWRVGRETGALGPTRAGVSPVYLDPACSGAAYLALADEAGSPVPPPRVVFTLLGESTLRVRPDSSAGEPHAGETVYSSAGGACAALAAAPGRLLLPAAGTAPAQPLTPPASPFAPPLRQELR